MAKEKPVKQETEEQTAIRKEIRKEWGSMEPRLIEMAHKLDDNYLTNNKDHNMLKSIMFYSRNRSGVNTLICEI